MISSALVWPGFVADQNTDGVVDAHIDSRRLGDGRVDHRLTLEAWRNGSALWTKEITFAVDAPFEVPDLTTADPFLIAALFPAMEVGGTLRIHGTVSRVLMRNIHDYLSAWHLAARHLYRPFELQVEAIDDDLKLDLGPHPNAILAFSGDMDSVFALCRNVSGDAGIAAYSIGATMLINGIAIGRGMAADDAALINDMRGMSGRWNLPMGVVGTNISDVVGNHVASYGTWLASCLGLFSERFDIGLVGSSITSFSPGYEIYGSHPLLDPLLSGSRMAIRNDEGVYQRPEKAALLSKHPEALRDLRICYDYYDHNRNCCRCENCIRTMLSFIASGNPIPPAFPDGLNLQDIGTSLGGRTSLDWATMILHFAIRYGTSDHEAIRVLRRRYREKWLKVRVGDWYKRLTTGRMPHRWRIFDQA